MSEVPEMRQQHSIDQLDVILENLSRYLEAVGSVAKSMQVIPLEKRQTIEPMKERAEQLLDDRRNELIPNLTRGDVEPIANAAKTLALIYWGSGSPSSELLTEEESQLAPHKEPVLACTDHILHEIEKSKAHLQVLEGEPYIYPPDSEPIANAIRSNWTTEKTTLWGAHINQKFADNLQRGTRLNQDPEPEPVPVGVPFSERRLPNLNLERVDPGAFSGALNVVAMEKALPPVPAAELLMVCPNLDIEPYHTMIGTWEDETGMGQQPIEEIVSWFQAALESDQFGDSMHERRATIGEIMKERADRHQPDLGRSYAASDRIPTPAAPQDEVESASISSIQRQLEKLREQADGAEADQLAALAEQVGALDNAISHGQSDVENSNGPSLG